MDRFVFREGHLHCENVPVADIAAAVGTPTFIYSAGTLREHYERIVAAFAELNPLICFSVKSCANLHILKLLGSLGAGMDVVSGGELHRARRTGVDPGKIVYAGVGKTDVEIGEALAAGIGWFNVESEQELENLIVLAERHKATAHAALRINPDVDPKTHRHTTTGKRETKFGVDLERARRVFDEFGRNARVKLSGIHMHIGSPVNTVQPYVEAVTKALGLIAELRQDGFAIDTLNLGGGYGAYYEGTESPTAASYAEQIVPLLRGQGLRLILEPGRSIAANAGILLTRTQYVKQSGDKQFIIVDGSMTELIRPALYDAYHFIWPADPGLGFVPDGRLNGMTLPGTRKVDIVGPVCETGDFLGRDRSLPPIQRGGLVVVFTVGAYGFAMASHYNSRPNAAEVLVEGDRFRVIRRRETYDDLLAAEEAP